LQHACSRSGAQGHPLQRFGCPGQESAASPPARPPFRRGWPEAQRGSRKLHRRGRHRRLAPSQTGQGRGQAAAVCHALNRPQDQASWGVRSSTTPPAPAGPAGHTLGGHRAAPPVHRPAAWLGHPADGRAPPRLASRGVADPGGPLQQAHQEVSAPSARPAAAGARSSRQQAHGRWRQSTAQVSSKPGCRPATADPAAGHCCRTGRPDQSAAERPLFSHWSSPAAQGQGVICVVPRPKIPGIPEFRPAIPRQRRHFRAGLGSWGRGCPAPQSCSNPGGARVRRGTSPLPSRHGHS